MSERARAQAETLFLVRRLLRLAVVVAVVLAAGTVAFALVEEMSPWRGFVTTLEPAGVVAVVLGACDNQRRYLNLVEPSLESKLPTASRPRA